MFKTFLKESLFTALIDNVLSDKTKCMSSWHKTEINVLYVTQDRDCTAVIWCMKMVCNRLLLLNNWCEILYNIWLWGGDWFKYVLLKKISNSKNSLSMSRVTCSKMVNVYFKLLCYIYELWSSADDAVTSRSNRLLGPDTRPCVQKRVIVTHLWFKYVLLKKISNSKNSLSMSRVTCSKMVNVYFKLLCYIYELWSSADDQLSLVPRA